MEQIVLDQAESLGFSCQLNDRDCWEILPIQPEETWKLVQDKSRWILSIQDVAQLRLDTGQAIAFLDSRAK